MLHIENRNLRFWKQFGIGFVAGIITSAATVVLAGDVKPINGRLTAGDIERVRSLQSSQAPLLARTLHRTHDFQNPALQAVRNLDPSELVVVRTFNTAGEMRDYLIRAIAHFRDLEIDWSADFNPNGSWSRLKDLHELEPNARRYAEMAIRSQELLKAELKETDELIAKNGRSATIVKEQAMTVEDLRAKIKSDSEYVKDGMRLRSNNDSYHRTFEPFASRIEPPTPQIEIHRAGAVGVTRIPSANGRAIFGRNRLGLVLSVAGALTVGAAMNQNTAAKPVFYETNISPEPAAAEDK